MKNKIITILLSAVLVISIGANIYQYNNTSNVTANLNELTNSKNELTAEIESKTTELDSLTADIEELNSKISELTADVGSLIAENNSLQGEIDQYVEEEKQAEIETTKANKEEPAEVELSEEDIQAAIEAGATYVDPGEAKSDTELEVGEIGSDGVMFKGSFDGVEDMLSDEEMDALLGY